MEEIIRYLIRFLIRNDNVFECNYIGYTRNIAEVKNYKIIIYPSDFFSAASYGAFESLPNLPLKHIDGIPLLFGEPKVVKYKGSLIIYADIIASTYFLITRYEEICRRNVRDMYGRFPGKESILYKAGCIDRPLVDEYSRFLRQCLQSQNVQLSDFDKKLKKIWLTHDVDSPYYCQTARSFIREWLNGDGLLNALNLYSRTFISDPYYTFPWIFGQNLLLKDSVSISCDTLIFLKSSGCSKLDKPYYKLDNRGIRMLISMCKQYGFKIGLHSSYDAGCNSSLILFEKKILEDAIHLPVQYNRHHYLSLLEPEDTDQLEAAGITDDFTMGYADVAGFRLGTSCPVRWINPSTRRLSSLHLHPLIAMDCSLSDEKYMGMDFSKAFGYVKRLIDQCEIYNGELVLLWHNDTLSLYDKGGCHSLLYLRILEYLKKRC